MACMSKNLISSGFKNPYSVLVLIIPMYWLTIKLVFDYMTCFENLGQTQLLQFPLEPGRFFLVPYERKIVLEISTTVTSIDCVTWPIIEICTHLRTLEYGQCHRFLRDLQPSNVSSSFKKVN